MVECARCKKTRFKMNDTIAAYIDGKPVLVCKKCASDEIGKQEPAFYYKKPEDPYDK